MGIFNAFVAYKFLKILSTPFKKTDAYKTGVLDKDGNQLIKRKNFSSDQKKSYNIFHHLIYKLKKLMHKVPIMKSRIGSFATALWFIKQTIKEEYGESEATMIEEVFLDYLKDNGYNIELNESLINGEIAPGTYIKEGKKYEVVRAIKPFDYCLGVPLYKVDNDIVTEEEMKNYNEFSEEVAIANNAGSGSVAGLDGEPPVSKKNQKIHRRKNNKGVTAEASKKNESVQESNDTFAGNRVFSITDDEYSKCLHGRNKHERWSKKLNMDEFSNCNIRTYHHRNPSKSIVIQNNKTGEMSYLVQPSKGNDK